jgi:menaquinone-dependent protoporphyrinogen IX oxidase
MFSGLNMKILIIYHSVHHHNTLKIAKAMTQAVDANLEDVSEVNQDILDDYDVVRIGLGSITANHTRKSKVSSKAWITRKIRRPSSSLPVGQEMQIIPRI